MNTCKNHFDQIIAIKLPGARAEIREIFRSFFGKIEEFLFEIFWPSPCLIFINFAYLDILGCLWFLLKNIIFMFFHIHCVQKFLTTIITLGFSLGMPSGMIAQSIFSVKFFHAVFTRKRFFSSMGSFVALSPTFLRKLLVTMSTGKWFVTSMKPFNLEIAQDLNFSF